MVKNVIRIDDMACSMCEARVGDAVWKQFPDAKKVSASHEKKETSFAIEEPADGATIKKVIDKTDYHYEDPYTESCEEKRFSGLFG